MGQKNGIFACVISPQWLGVQGIAMLEVIDISCRKGGKALFTHLSFQVMPGQCWVIEGGNGSGKTSLLRIVANLSQPESGILQWKGQAIAEVEPAYRHHILYGGHSAGVSGELSVQENLSFLLSMDGVAPEQSVYMAALKRCGLFSLRHQQVQKLSAGQKKRCFLVRLALSQRSLWVLDEQLTALDHAGQDLLGELVAQQVAAGGAVVMTSHQPVPWTVAMRSLHLGAA